jgi:predicted DNA-binding protein
MRGDKTDHLRVRLTSPERESLEKLAAKRGKGETLSEVVREAIQAFTNHDPSRATCTISAEAMKQVQALARTLNRSEAAVLEECIQGIADLVGGKGNQTPLIVQEYNLRKNYKSSGS